MFWMTQAVRNKINFLSKAYSLITNNVLLFLNSSITKPRMKIRVTLKLRGAIWSLIDKCIPQLLFSKLLHRWLLIRGTIHKCYCWLYDTRLLKVKVSSYSKTNQMYQFPKLFFLQNTPLVSGGLSVHHQELKTVHTATSICQFGTVTCLLASM
jgi:hypothetical protein